MSDRYIFHCVRQTCGTSIIFARRLPLSLRVGFWLFFGKLSTSRIEIASVRFQGGVILYKVPDMLSLCISCHYRCARLSAWRCRGLPPACDWQDAKDFQRAWCASHVECRPVHSLASRS